MFPKNPYASAEWGYTTNWQCDLAREIIKHCAMVTAVEDGEDSTGRAKAKLLSAADVATRACDIAEHMVAIFNERGWVKDNPMDMADAMRVGGVLSGIRDRASYALDDDKSQGKLAVLIERLESLTA